MSGSVSIFDLVQSHRITAVIYVAAKLNLAEVLETAEKSAAELARLVSADERALRRLLVALSTIGVCKQIGRDRFCMTDLGRQLDQNANRSFKDWVLFEGELLVQSWAGLIDSVRSGKTASQIRGEGNDRYAAMANSPEVVGRFNAAMASLTRSLIPKIVETYDFSRPRVVMDIGGGSGELIGGVLLYNPRLKGIAFDLARCAAGARQHFEHLGIADRCRFIAGDFFETIPQGADTILMKSIIHNWDDDRSRIILRKSWDALPPGGKLILIERIMPELPVIGVQARECAMSDLNMLRGPGGFERAETEYRTLAASAGFAFARASGAGLFSLIEFDKAAD